VLATGAPLLAQSNGIHLDVSAERKLHNDASKKSSTNDTNKGGEECAYDIVVTNTSLKDVPALDVQYQIFIQRQRLGEKKDVEHSDKVTGSATLPALKSLQKGSVATKSFPLSKANLQGGWTYYNGGRQSAKDTVKGIWVKIYDGQTLLAEFANPSTVKDKETWESGSDTKGAK
jgi:hypothetical protein